MKKLLALALMLALIVSIAGCAAPPQEPADQPAEQPAEEPEDEPEDEPEEVVAVTAVGFGMTDEEYEAALADVPEDNYTLAKMLVNDWVTKINPNIDVDFQNWGWAEALDQKQRAAILSGVPPDIVHGEVFMPVYALHNILEPLPQDIVDKVHPNFLINDADGRPVAVSPSGAIFMLFYNRGLLREMGLPEDPVINTWEDWKELSDQITAKGGGDIWGGGIPTFPHMGGALRVAPFIRQMGMDFGGGSTPTLNTPEWKELLTYIREMNKNIPPGIGNNPDEGPHWTLWTNEQQIVFAVDGFWRIREAALNNVDAGAMNLPLPPGGVYANTLVGFNYHGVTRASQNKEEAFDVIRAILNPDSQLKIAQDVGRVVALRSILEDPATYAELPLLQAGLEAFLAHDIQGLPVWDKNDAQIWEIINTRVLARATMTNDPVDVILSEAQAEIERLLK